MKTCPQCNREFKNGHAMKVHLHHCKMNLSPEINDSPDLGPPALESPNLRSTIRVSDAIRKVQELAKDVGGMEELVKISAALI